MIWAAVVTGQGAPDWEPLGNITQLPTHADLAPRKQAAKFGSTDQSEAGDVTDVREESQDPADDDEEGDVEPD